MRNRSQFDSETVKGWALWGWHSCLCSQAGIARSWKAVPLLSLCWGCSKPRTQGWDGNEEPPSSEAPGTRCKGPPPLAKQEGMG